MTTDRLDSWISKVGANTEKQATQNSNTKSVQKNPNPSSQQKKRRFFSRKKKHSSENTPSKSHSNTSHSSRPLGKSLRAIPFGGLNEVGRNCLGFEYGNDIILVDAGFQFPEEEMYGVDYVLPDTRYAEQKKQNIRGILITHAHLDHIGGLPYLLPRLGFPTVFASPLAAGMIQKQIREHKGMEKVNIRKIDPDKDTLKLGAFTVEFFRVNHSIPDANGIYIQTPVGNVVHTGDFKFDFSPADKTPADFGKIAQIGQRGVDAIFADSTNAQKEGFCISERIIANTLENIIRNTKKGRLFITSFSSVLGRWQQIIEFAQKHNRKIYVTGRSLLENLRIASDAGYIRVPQGKIHKATKRMHSTPPHEQLIITTGAQGEEAAALSRIARGEHSTIKMEKEDTVVFSSSPIPGNERQMSNVINAIYKIGARVITNKMLDVHSSGHAHQGDLKLMYSLLKPKHIVPVHGEYHMRVEHARMVKRDLGYTSENVHIIENGDILEMMKGKVRTSREKASGEHVFVDGKIVSTEAEEMIKERKAMMNDGMVSFVFRIDQKKKDIKSPPICQSAGFSYPQELSRFHALFSKEAVGIAKEVLKRYKNASQQEKFIRQDLQKKLAAKIVQLTDKEPEVLVTTLVE